MTRTRRTPAASTSRAIWESSAALLENPRTATWGTGSKPAAASRQATSTCAAGGRAGTALT